jgi:hypothetical protein
MDVPSLFTMANDLAPEPKTIDKCIPMAEPIEKWNDPALRPIVDTYRSLGDRQEEECVISLGDATFIVQIMSSDKKVLVLEATDKLTVRVSKKVVNQGVYIARCEVLIKDVALPGWQEQELAATVVVVSAERKKAFYVMKDLAASEQSLDVPDATRTYNLPFLTGTVNPEIESGDFGKDDRVTFGAEQEATLLYDPDEEAGYHAVLNLINIGENKANISLTVVAACQAGVFATHEPTLIAHLLRAHDVIAKPSSKKVPKRKLE